MPVVSQLYIYPVKSLGGIAVQQWPVDATGLRYDRRWMIVDSLGNFLSQRRLAQMALIKTRMDSNQLWLSAPEHGEIGIPLSASDGERVSVRVWDDQCLAHTVSADVDAWLSTYLQQACRLVYHPDDQRRAVDPDYAQASDQTAFSDGFPFLLASEASLQHFNQHSCLDIGMARFRPNIVVSDCEAYAEDRWRQIRINSLGFRLPKPCSRCAIPGIDPDTAETQPAVLSALAKWRKWNNKVYFGQNALHDDIGMLSVGDEVTVVISAHAQPPQLD